MCSKNVIAIALSLSILTIINTPTQAAGKRRGGGGRGGGVYLQTPNPTNPLEHNNRAVELGSKGLWADAIREHEIALEGDPHRTEFRVNLSAAHMQFGKTLAARGRTYEAMAQFRKAMFVDPNNAEADVELAKCLAKLGKNPDNPEVRRQIGEDADVKGDYETAVVEFRKYANMKVDSGQAHADLGNVLLKAGKTKDGYKELRIAVSKEWPRDQTRDLAAAHRKIGDVLKEQAFVAKDGGRGSVGMKRLANAAIEYRRAVQLNPIDANAIRGLLEVSREAVNIRPQSFDNHLALGGAYLLSGDFDHARMEYEQCFKLDPRRPEVDQARIAYHQSVARSPLASDALVAQSVDKIKGLIDQNSENARLWYILGRLRERQADPEKAKKSYERAWSINKHIDPDLAAGFTRLGLQNPDGTTGPLPEREDPKLVADKQAKIEEQNKALMKEKKFVEVDNLVNEGKTDDAIAKGQELFKEDTKNGRIARIIGSAYEKQQKFDDAKSWYRLAAGLGDKDADSFLSQLDSARVVPKLAEADELVNQAKYVEAATAYRDAIVLAPKRADIRRKLGDVLSKMGDKEGARKEIEEADKLDRK